MKKTISTLILLFIITSCKKKNDDITSISQITTNYDTLRNRIIYKGDVNAYNELYYGFMDSNEAERTDSLMIYSKIMAEKFNNEGAYLDYFKALCEKYGINVDYPNYNKINLSQMPESSKKQAEDWLKKMLKKRIITQEQYNLVKK